MSVTKYEKDGETFWRVYIDLRGRKNCRVRVQKRINGLKSEREALTVEKRLVRELTEQVGSLESKGIQWLDVIERWVRQQELYPTKRLAATTIMDYEAVLRNWTTPWLNRIASRIVFSKRQIPTKLEHERVSDLRQIQDMRNYRE